MSNADPNSLDIRVSAELMHLFADLMNDPPADGPHNYGWNGEYRILSVGDTSTEDDDPRWGTRIRLADGRVFDLYAVELSKEDAAWYCQVDDEYNMEEQE